MNPELPFNDLRFIIGTINYGGRITETHDDRLINAILSDYLNADIKL